MSEFQKPYTKEGEENYDNIFKKRKTWNELTEENLIKRRKSWDRLSNHDLTQLKLFKEDSIDILRVWSAIK